MTQTPSMMSQRPSRGGGSSGSTLSTRPPPARTQPSGEAAGSSSEVTRWMWIWITIAILVIIVVVGFLLGINSNLTAIDNNLATTQSAAQGIEGDAAPLTGNVDSINSSLVSIDEELAAIPGQANQIISNLTTIRNRLAQVDSSLVDTSGTLVTVQGVASDIENVLEQAESPEDDLGTSDIFQRVDRANGILRSARSDTRNIVPQLASINDHLTSVCNALEQAVVGLAFGNNCPS